MVMIVVMVPVAVMASSPRIFQVTAAAFRLTAVLTMFAFRVMQLLLRTAYSLFALFVVIAIKRPRRNCPAQE
jgi:hypothetical protein